MNARVKFYPSRNQHKNVRTARPYSIRFDKRKI